jgi:hypothetical protein
VDCIPQTDFDLFPLAHYPDVRIPQLAQKIQGRLCLLAQGQPQRVLLTPLTGGFLDVRGQTVEPVRRAGSLNALMRPLVIIVRHPVGNPLAGIRKRSKQSFLQKFLPDRLPEPLDLAQRHRMVCRAAHMSDPLLLQDLLKPRLASPGCKLPAVVRQDLPGRTPLADSSLDHFQHRLRSLLSE